MEISIKTGNFLLEPSELGVLAVFEDAPLPAEVASLLETDDFPGKAGQTLLLYPRGALAPKRLLLVGMGKRDALSTEGIRRVSATAVQEARNRQVAVITIGVHGDLPLDPEAATQAFAEGIELGAYRFARYFTGLSPEQNFAVESATLFTNTDGQARRGVAVGQMVGRGCVLCP